MTSMLSYRSTRITSMSKSGVSSLVTRLTSDAFVLDAVCGFYVEDGGHYTLDDGFQCSLDSHDQSFFSVDCSGISTISCCRRLVCSS